MELDKKIGFVGAGNMGCAIMGAMVSAGVSKGSLIHIHDADPSRAEAVKAEYGVNIAPSGPAVFDCCDVVILAVKPKDMAGVLKEIVEKSVHGKEIAGRKLVISVAAGVTLGGIEKILHGADEGKGVNPPVVRVMPNTPAMVLEGVSGVTGNAFVHQEDMGIVKTIFGAMGDVLEFGEEYMDAVTALSGSGPAYVFYLAEAMIEAGINLGFDPADAVRMTMGTIKGAAKLMEESQESPSSLRARVTSPGGTTEAAMRVFDNSAVKRSIMDGIEAAALRAGELSDMMNR